jgi:cell growth-regulating nucleolar protein
VCVNNLYLFIYLFTFTYLFLGEDQSVEEEEPQEDVGFVGDFKWGETIKQVLLNQPEYEISMKKLRKKVISEYYAVIGDGKGMKTQEELFSKLNKKLKKQQFKVIKDTVKLVV